MSRTYRHTREDWEDIAGDAAPSCPTCQAENAGAYIGTLGPVEHFRCRYCGMDFHQDTRPVAPEPRIL